MENVYDSLIRCLSPQTENEAYKTVGEEAMKLVNAKYSSILIFKNGLLQRVWASSPILFIIQPRKKGYLYKIFKEKKERLFKSAEVESVHPQFKLLEVGSSIGIPLKHGNEIIGVLSVMSDKKNSFSMKELQILKYFEPVITLTIKKAIIFSKLQKAIQSRDTFISLAAHELKNPLTAAFLYTQLAIDQTSKGETPSMEILERILNEERRIKSMIDDLLDIGHVKSGNLNYKMVKCEIQEIINQAEIIFRSNFPYHHFYIKKCEGKHYVKGDQSKLIQAIVNLLNNAAKYSVKGSSIYLNLKQESNYLGITIKDQGIGIPENDLQQIFKPFYRSKNANREGLGLGLYLVKNIIDKHKGKIEIQSKVSKGTAVSISLPIYQNRNIQTEEIMANKYISN